GPQPYPAALSPSARIAREVAALRTLHDAGILVPRVLAANPAAAVMLVEKLPGRSLVRVLATQVTVSNRSKYGSQRRETTEPDGDGCKFRLIRTYRTALDRVHAAGLVLNDAHPGNALVDGDDVALIDLEFAEPSRDPDRIAFDLAYAAQYFRRNERTVFLARTDLRGLDRELSGYAPLFAYEANRLRAA
ncbi:MAG TPA: phosphotransferase, partial [Kofleriaceae bacterium]